MKNFNNNYNLAKIYNNFAKFRSNYNDFTELNYSNPINPILQGTNLIIYLITKNNFDCFYISYTFIK